MEKEDDWNIHSRQEEGELKHYEDEEKTESIPLVDSRDCLYTDWNTLLDQKRVH